MTVVLSKDNEILGLWFVAWENGVNWLAIASKEPAETEWSFEMRFRYPAPVFVAWRHYAGRAPTGSKKRLIACADRAWETAKHGAPHGRAVVSQRIVGPMSTAAMASRMARYPWFHAKVEEAR